MFDLDRFDPRTPEFVANPYPFYAWLRREDPVHFIPALKWWWLTRYRDVELVLKDHRLGKEIPADLPSATPMIPPEYGRLAELPASMIFRDPPDHTRLRALVNHAFTPRTVERLRARVEDIATQLLDLVAPAGAMDVVRDFAYPLPVTVIAELLGVPAEDHPRFREWSLAVTRGIDPTQAGTSREDSLRANVALVNYFDQLIIKHRSHPGPDLITELIRAEEEGQKLSHDEIVSTCVLLLIAGHETTTNLISMGTLTLLQHPDDLARLRADMTIMPTAVEELLRYESPVQRFGRVVHQDIELGGKMLQRGQRVSAVISAANRDPEIFENPERLNLTRQHNPHLAFGRGIHFCLGAPLARIEAPIAFRLLLERFARLALAGEPEWNPNTTIRGLHSLPVVF